MSVINNERDLEKLLEIRIIEWLKQLQNDLPELLKDYIISEYYEQYTPSDLYERQYRILKSILASSIKKTGRTYYLDIYLDPKKISYDPSIWGYVSRSGVSYSYLKGDSSETVFQNMANGVHGSVEFGTTDGRFWEAFLKSLGYGGVYNIFEKFKKQIGKNCMVSF